MSSAFSASCRPANGGRLPAGVAAVAVHVALGYALIVGLGVELTRSSERTLSVFAVPRPTPTPDRTPRPRPLRSKVPEGEAARPNLRAKPSPIVAPPLVVPLPPVPVQAAPVAGAGDAPTVGAAPTPGPGVGAGGVGHGFGAGGRGGDSGDGGVAMPSRQIAGAIRDRDYPKSARRARAQGTVIVRLDIDERGRVARCGIASTSGHAELDDGTCRLIRSRFVYEPARDARGDPTPDVRFWRQDWWMEPR